jgi:hypothetical protein
LVGAAYADRLIFSKCRAPIYRRSPPGGDRSWQTIKFTRQSIFSIPGKSAPAVWPQNSPDGCLVGQKHARSTPRSCSAISLPETLAAPQSTGAAQLGKHPVEIGHDEIEVRFAPMSRRLGVGPDVRPGLYFPAYFGNSVQAVWPARQNSPGSASASASYLVMTGINKFRARPLTGLCAAAVPDPSDNQPFNRN